MLGINVILEMTTFYSKATLTTSPWVDNPLRVSALEIAILAFPSHLVMQVINEAAVQTSLCHRRLHGTYNFEYCLAGGK